MAQSRIPALTPFWESVPGSGIFFAGNATQGAPGLRKHGIGSASPAVHGFRYNARIMTRHLAETHLGLTVPRDRLQGELVPYLLSELTTAPELWTQKSYLARTVRDDGEIDIVPLAHFLDEDGQDGVAVAVETNAAGELYPAVYVRRSGHVAEHLLPSSRLNDFRGAEYERELAALL